MTRSLSTDHSAKFPLSGIERKGKLTQRETLLLEHIQNTLNTFKQEMLSELRNENFPQVDVEKEESRDFEELPIQNNDIDINIDEDDIGEDSSQ